MIRAFAFALILVFSGSAMARQSCEPDLKAANYAAQVQRDFKTVVDSLRTLGLSKLVEPFDQGRVTVSFRSPRRWIPGLPSQNVSGKKTFLGSGKLIVRRLDLSDKKQFQAAQWEVALAIYQMQIDKRLLDIRSMIPSGNPRTFALNSEAEDEILSYFLAEMPIEWRDQRLADISALEGDLYTLLGQMDQWSDKDLLEKKDAGRWWIAGAVWGGDASQSIRPNRRDFEHWRQKGGLTLADTLNKRHRHSVLFNYYFDYVKRSILALAVASVVVHLPNIVQIPGQVAQAYSGYQSLKASVGDPGAADQFNRDYLRHLHEEDVKDRDDLVLQIQQEEAQATPDQGKLSDLRGELAELLKSDPEL